MKISCTQQNLQKGLSIVSRTVNLRGSLPILGNVLMSTDKGRVKLVTTDLEIAVSTYIGAKIDEEGSTTVPAKLFSEFVATNTDPTIESESKEGSLELKSQRFKATIKGMPAEDFPLIPEVKPKQQFSLPALQFKQALEQVMFATALDETRPILTGVYVNANGSTLTLAATDSYRLAEKTITLVKKVDPEITVIVPFRSISELARIIDETIDMVEVAIGENQIKFTIGQTELISRLLEGKFPDYKQIIPQKTSSQAVVQSQELLNSIKMASFFAREVANNIKVRLGAEKLEVAAVSPQLGNASSTVKASVNGEELEAAFNAKFLSDGLQAIGSEMVSFELSGKLSPGVLKAASAKTGKDDYIYIVMPLKLEE